MEALKTRTDAGTAFGSVRLFWMREEFPAEWAMFLGAPAWANGKFALSLSLHNEHFPLWSKDRLGLMKTMQLWTRRGDGAPGAPLRARLAAGTNKEFPLTSGADDLLVMGGGG